MPKDVPLRRINHRQKTARARAVVELEGATVLDSTDNYPPIPPEPPAPVTFIPAVVWTEEDAEANYSAYSYVSGDVTSLGTGAESMGLFYGLGGAGAKVEIDGMEFMGVVDGTLYGTGVPPTTLYEWDGEAWSEVRALYGTARAAFSVAFGSDGRIYLSYATGYPTRTVWCTYTDDQGATWSTPAELGTVSAAIGTCCREQSGHVFVAYGNSTTAYLACSHNNGETWQPTATVTTGSRLETWNYAIGFSETTLYMTVTERDYVNDIVYIREFATTDWAGTEWVPTLVREVNTSSLAPANYKLAWGYAHLSSGWNDGDYRGLFFEGYIDNFDIGGTDERLVIASLESDGTLTQIQQSAAGTSYAYVFPAQYGTLASFASSGGGETPTLTIPEGWGASTTGGDAGDEVAVTTLANSGAGSFREAVTASGTRKVTFSVSGEIELDSHILITNPNLTIDGSTAPGAVTITNSGSCEHPALIIAASDVKVQYIRIRPGPSSEPTGSLDCLQIGMTGYEVRNVVVDHCSFAYGVDENVSGYNDNWTHTAENVTISYCIIAWGLHNDAYHPEGAHGFGFIMGRGMNNWSIHHNLFALNDQRNPMIKAGCFDFRNNVVYGWGTSATYLRSDSGENTLGNIVNNYYKESSGTSNSTKEIYAQKDSDVLMFYLSGNVGPNSSTQWNMVQYAAGTNEGLVRVDTPFEAETVTTVSAADAYTDVLANAGCTLPSRDAIDTAIVAHVTAGDGALATSV